MVRTLERARAHPPKADGMSPPPISRRRFLKTLGFSGAGMVGLSGYGLAVEPGYRLEVTRYTVRPRNWIAGLHLTVGVIAPLFSEKLTVPVKPVTVLLLTSNAVIFNGMGTPAVWGDDTGSI